MYKQKSKIYIIKILQRHNQEKLQIQTSYKLESPEFENLKLKKKHPQQFANIPFKKNSIKKKHQFKKKSRIKKKSAFNTLAQVLISLPLQTRFPKNRPGFNSLPKKTNLIREVLKISRTGNSLLSGTFYLLLSLDKGSITFHTLREKGTLTKFPQSFNLFNKNNELPIADQS